MPSPEEIMMMLESQVNGEQQDPRMEMMKKLMMGGAAGLAGGPLAGMGGMGEMAKMMMGGGGPPPGLMAMSADAMAETTDEGIDSLPPGQARPAPDPEEKMRFTEMMKMMMLGPGLQAMMAGAQQGAGPGMAQSAGPPVPGSDVGY